MERPHFSEIGDFVISRHDHIDETVYSVGRKDRERSIATYSSPQQFREEVIKLTGEHNREYLTWWLYLAAEEREEARAVYQGQPFTEVKP